MQKHFPLTFPPLLSNPNFILKNNTTLVLYVKKIIQRHRLQSLQKHCASTFSPLLSNSGFICKNNTTLVLSIKGNRKTQIAIFAKALSFDLLPLIIQQIYKCSIIAKLVNQCHTGCNLCKSTVLQPSPPYYLTLVLSIKIIHPWFYL